MIIFLTLQAATGIVASAAICGVLVGGSLLLFIVFRLAACQSTVLSSAEANVVFCFRVGILQILVGIAGLLGSFATVSSVLMLAGGSTVAATMKDLKSAIDISKGRLSACSAPFHAANLAIAGIVFGIIDAVTGVILSTELIPIIFSVPDSCRAGSNNYSPSFCLSYYSEVCTKPRTFICGAISRIMDFPHISNHLQRYYEGMAVLNVYFVNMITVASAGLVLNIFFLAFYCQVRNSSPASDW